MHDISSVLRPGAVMASVLIMGSAAVADETDAKQILRAMSDYMAGTDTLSFDYDATLEVVTTENQKLGIAVSGTLSLARPDRIRATRSGGFADVEMVYDGETFTLLGKHAGLYTQIPFKGSIDELIDTMREQYGHTLPAADLLSANPYDLLMSDVTDVKDLGAGVIGGIVCDHLAFRTPDVDWQIWIAQGEQPYPCRYEITTHGLPQAPQYRVDVRDWRGDDALASDAFAFLAPPGANAIAFDALKDTVSEFPENYKLGETQ